MNINYKGKELELRFDFRFLREIDNILGFKMEEMSIGQGVSMLPAGLEMGNPVVIGETILAATKSHKKAPSIKDLDDILDDIAENIGLEEFGQQVIEELGKRPMTRNLVEKEESEETNEKKSKKNK